MLRAALHASTPRAVRLQRAFTMRVARPLLPRVFHVKHSGLCFALAQSTSTRANSRDGQTHAPRVALCASAGNTPPSAVHTRHEICGEIVNLRKLSDFILVSSPWITYYGSRRKGKRNCRKAARDVARRRGKPRKPSRNSSSLCFTGRRSTPRLAAVAKDKPAGSPSLRARLFSCGRKRRPAKGCAVKAHKPRHALSVLRIPLNLQPKMFHVKHSRVRRAMPRPISNTRRPARLATLSATPAAQRLTRRLPPHASFDIQRPTPHPPRASLGTQRPTPNTSARRSAQREFEFRSHTRPRRS